MKTFSRVNAHKTVVSFHKILSPRKLMLLLSVLFLSSFSAKAQSHWKPVKAHAPHASGGVMLLLSDGSVMAKSNFGSSAGNTWTRLRPDSLGSYANGTWTVLPAMKDDRLYFSSQVLKDGRVYVAGGEYGTGGSAGEIYNPLTNAWTQLPNPGRRISDANSYILEDGRVLQACVDGNLRGSLIFNPATNTYGPAPDAFGLHNESAWLKLPDNSILYVDRDTRNSERFIPSLNKWVVDAKVPVDLYDPFGSETGAAFLLPNGRGFFIGSLGFTAYYTPSGTTAPGVWTAGPKLPNNQGVPDAPGAMMVNGKILLAVSPVPFAGNHFPAPTSYYEFDYTTNSYTQVSAPQGTLTANHPVYVANMLTLPDGTVLYGDQGNDQYYIYTPTGKPLVAGKPMISQITANTCSGSSYTIKGKGFNGISEGASYGDDWQMSTNYPIVRLTKGNRVYYARTYNWNSTGVKRGSAADNAQFTLPAGLPMGTYSLVVNANGISSDPVSFTHTNNCMSVVITSPVNNATFGAPANITITANATASSGTITNVAFYSGSILLGHATAHPYSIVWHNVSAGTYNIRAVATNNHGESKISDIVTVVVKAPVNLALHRPAKASSSRSSFGPQLAVDGNLSTRWASSFFGTTQWLGVDLGVNFHINHVKINWEANYSPDYVLQTSHDGVNWTTFHGVHGNHSLVNDLTGLNGTGRYIRVSGRTKSFFGGLSIFEFEVYGTHAPEQVARLAAVESTTIETNTNQLNVSNVYPNPASEHLFISVETSEQKALHISITDLSMKEVVSMDHTANSGSNTIQVPLSELPAGFYILRVSGPDQMNFTRKIIKQ